VDDAVAVALKGRADGTVGLLDQTMRRVGASCAIDEELGLPGAYSVL
jgi:hypothetical protein